MWGIISPLTYNIQDSQNDSEEQPNFLDVTPCKVVTTERARRPRTLFGRRTLARVEIKLNAQSLLLPKKKNRCNTQGHVTEVTMSFTVFHVWDFLHFAAPHAYPPWTDAQGTFAHSVVTGVPKNIYRFPHSSSSKSKDLSGVTEILDTNA